MLRAFQALHKGALDPGFMADVELLRHKDLDLSVKLGALLAFNALIINAGLQPISASPGAPLAIQATAHPLIAVTTLLGVLALVASAYFCVRAVMVGEEFDDHGIENDPKALAQRMFAAYCAAIDLQVKLLGRATRLTLYGGALCALGLFWAMAEKFFV